MGFPALTHLQQIRRIHPQSRNRACKCSSAATTNLVYKSSAMVSTSGRDLENWVPIPTSSKIFALWYRQFSGLL